VKKACFCVWSLNLVLLGSLIAFDACSTNQIAQASAANGVVITSVDGAMGLWASYINSHITSNAPTAQQNAEIIAVSNSYVAYYNCEIVLSNTAAAYVASPTTNLAQAYTLAEKAVYNSQSNIVGLVTQFTK
jgi:hypothetical protein